MTESSTDAGLELFDVESTLPLFERFVELVPDGVIGVGEGGRIVLANRHAEEIFGYAEGELTKLSLGELVPEGVRADHSWWQARYSESPRPRRMGSGLELRGVRADGTEIPLDISLTSIRSGRRTIALAFVRDMSDRRRTAGESA